jgi:hypothetical protein
VCFFAFCFYIIHLPLQSPDVKKDEGIGIDKIKVYCSELLTNADSSQVFQVLMSTELLEYFFSFWQRPVQDPRVFKSFLNLSEYMLQCRFHAFVRAVQVWDFVIPHMVMQVDVPEVRQLIHALIANEAFVVDTVPELGWSQNSIVPLILARFRVSLDNLSDSEEVVTMCDFVGELLRYHCRSSPHIMLEIAGEFSLIAQVFTGGHTDFSEELFVLMMQFFPPKFGPGADMLHPPSTVPLCNLVKRLTSTLPVVHLGPIVYHEGIELFVSSKSFQRWISTHLSLETEKKLSLSRWRALVLVSGLVRMCTKDVDEALLASGNVGRFVDAVFIFPTSSILHTLVVDTILYICEHSDVALWVIVHHKFLERAVNLYLEHADLSQQERPNCFGHFTRLFEGLRNISRKLISDVLQSATKWSAVEVVLERDATAGRYDLMPDSSEINRERTLEHSPEMGKKPPTEKVAEEEEEVVEEIVEEITEEMIEE